MPPRTLRPWRALPLLLLLVVLLASGCSPVRLISDYDEQTDRGTTELHRKVEALLTSIEQGEGDEEAFSEGYRELLIDLRGLKLRAASRPMNDLQVRQFDALEEQLLTFGRAYREGISADEIPLFRRGFDQTFRAILTLELAKKRDAP